MVQRMKCFIEPSVEGFFSFNPNNTYHMIRQLVLNYALVIFISKKGDRSNNVQIQNAGRYKFSELFYGLNHHIYLETEYGNLLRKVIMPKEVKELRDKNMTYSQSSKEKKHQGADFILENKVKRQKMLASKRIDSEKMWRQVSRSLVDIIKINASANRKLRIHEVDGD